jgi:hypothetical protein
VLEQVVGDGKPLRFCISELLADFFAFSWDGFEAIGELKKFTVGRPFHKVNVGMDVFFVVMDSNGISQLSSFHDAKTIAAEGFVHDLAKAGVEINAGRFPCPRDFGREAEGKFGDDVGSLFGAAKAHSGRMDAAGEMRDDLIFVEVFRFLPALIEEELSEISVDCDTSLVMGGEVVHPADSHDTGLFIPAHLDVIFVRLI